MKYLQYFIILIFISTAMFLFCERISPPQQPMPDFVQSELDGLGSIPLDYGKLISVTSPKAGIAHLWFEDDSANIRMVQFNYGRNLMVADVTLIKRK